MRIYVAFDDTDILNCGRGTGKLARWFEDKLPEGCKLYGVVRQQLLVAEGIPYTSHNSSLCCIIEAVDESVIDELIKLGTVHIKENFFEGSDPGLCVAHEFSDALPALIEHGKACMSRKVTQEEAKKAAEGVHLSGHGGTNDGIIGAAAAVGLTHSGQCGRFVELTGKKRLREFDENVKAGELRENGIELLSVNRQAEFPLDDDIIETDGWLRPRLWNGGAIVPVHQIDEKRWIIVGKFTEINRKK